MQWHRKENVENFAKFSQNMFETVFLITFISLILDVFISSYISKEGPFIFLYSATQFVVFSFVKIPQYCCEYSNLSKQNVPKFSTSSQICWRPVFFNRTIHASTCFQYCAHRLNTRHWRVSCMVIKKTVIGQTWKSGLDKVLGGTEC